MTKEESITFNSAKKALEDEGYPFERINEYGDHGFVEDDWYEPRGTDSPRCHYLESDIQYILQKFVEKRAAKER